MGIAQFDCLSLSSISFTNFLSSESLNAFWPTRLDNNFFKDLLLTMRRTPSTPYASFHMTSIADDLSVPSIVGPVPALAAELQSIRQAYYDPSLKIYRDKSLIKYSLLAVTDDFSYTGFKFKH